MIYSVEHLVLETRLFKCVSYIRTSVNLVHLFESVRRLENKQQYMGKQSDYKLVGREIEICVYFVFE